MGNCISKMNKYHFFAFEEEMKMTSSLSRERQGVSLKCVPEVKNIQGFIP